MKSDEAYSDGVSRYDDDGERTIELWEKRSWFRRLFGIPAPPRSTLAVLIDIVDRKIEEKKP